MPHPSKLHTAMGKALAIMRKHGLDTSGCKTASDLSQALGKALPQDMAAQAQGLLADRGAVTALMERFTGDPNIGRKLDALYGPQKKNSAAKRHGRSKK